MKTLDDIKQDMSVLYDQVNDNNCDLKTAAELANIAGKFLKAEQLQLARLIFASQLGQRNQELLTVKDADVLKLASATQ